MIRFVSQVNMYLEWMQKKNIHQFCSKMHNSSHWCVGMIYFCQHLYIQDAHMECLPISLLYIHSFVIYLSNNYYYLHRHSFAMLYVLLSLYLCLRNRNGYTVYIIVYHTSYIYLTIRGYIIQNNISSNYFKFEHKRTF